MKKLTKRFLACLLSLLMVVSMIPMTVFAATDVYQSSYLKARWLVNNTSTDESGNGRTTSAGSGVTWSEADAFYAAKFDGTSNGRTKYQTGNNLLSDGIAGGVESGGAGTTIAFMAYAKSISASPYFSIYHSDYSSNNSRKSLFSLAPNGATVYTNNSGTAHNKSNSDTGAQITANEWHTIVIKFYSSKTMVIWVDGVKKFSETSDFYDNHTFDLTNTIKIGANRESDVPFNGYIRDFRIYNKDLDAPTLTQNLKDIAEETKDPSYVPSKNLSVSGYGCVSTGTRASGTSLTVCNDGEDGNFSIGYINFDLSNIDVDKYMAKSAEYTFTYTIASGREAKGLSVYYPTKYATDFTNSAGANFATPSAIKGSNGGHLARAITNNGLVKIKDINTSAGQTNASVTVDITDAINQGIKAGMSYATICIVIKEAGQTNSTGGWTDTIVNANTNAVTASLQPTTLGFDTSTITKYVDPRRPADGTTTTQPYIAYTTGPSQYFRIPGMVTMADGSVVTLADARWDRTADGGGNDTVVARSSDNGANWKYTYANYLSDNRDNAFNTANTGFCDSEIATDGTNLWMLSTVLPAGTGLNSGLTTPSSGDIYTSDGHLYLAASTNGNLGNFDYCLGDFDQNGFARVYTVSNGRIGTRPTGTYSWNQTQYNYKDIFVDTNFNIYNKPAAGGDYAYQSNLFFKTTVFGVRKTCHLVLRKSTDGGKTWGAPQPLNVKQSGEYFYGVGPGRGSVSSNGKVILFSAYRYAGASAQRSSLVYSMDGGKTWNRSPNAHESQCSESQVIILNENADGSMKLRLFFRSASETKIEYQDATLSANGTITWDSNVVTIAGTAKKNDCQISAIMYSKTIGGKKVIFVSTPTSSSTRGLGKIYALILNDDYSVNTVKSMDVTTSTASNSYMYSCLTELADGRIADLYENADGQITYKVFMQKQITGMNTDGAGEEVDAIETTGLINYDPVIYTKGQDYRDLGSTISTGSATYEDKTEYRVKSGYTIESITASDDNIVNPNGLTGTGYLSGAVDGTNETTKVTVDLTTILVRNSDGKKFMQKDRLYVATNPVPSNAACAVQTYTTNFWGTVTGIYNDMFVSVAEGSYPTYNTGSGGYSGNINNNGMVAALELETRDNPGGNRGLYIDEGGVKKAGYLECNNVKGGNSSATATSSTANYYLDLSVNSGNGHNRGVSYSRGATTNGSSYSIKMIHLPQKNANGSGTINVNVPTVSSSSFKVSGSASTRTMNTGTKAYHTISSTDMSLGTKLVTYTMSETETVDGYTLNPIVKIPISVMITDKGSLRTVYNNYVAEGKVSDCYTKSTWDAYSNAMLNAEAYLNKYDVYNTTDQSSLASALTAAHNALVLAERNENTHTTDTFTKTVIAPTCTEQGYTHYVASCGDEFDADYTKTIDHLRDVVTSLNDGRHNISCSRCGLVRSTVYCTYEYKLTLGDIKMFGCDTCNYTYTVDMSAYNSAVTKYQSVTSADDYTQMYTAASRMLYSSAYTNVNNYVKDNQVITQAELDTKVSSLQQAYTNLAKNKYTIVFEYRLNDDEETVVSNQSYDYGTNVILTVPSDVEGDVSKWVVNENGVDTKVNTTASTYSVVVKSNKTYICHISNENVETQDTYAKAVLKGVNNKVSDVKYLPKQNDCQVSISSNSITIGEEEFVAVDPAFYEVTGFEINDVEVTNLSVIDIQDDIVIKPIYSPILTLRISPDVSSDIKINGNNTLFDAKWNTKVKLTGTNTNENTAWYVDNQIVGYGNSYTFYATKACTVKYANLEESQVAPTAHVDYFAYNQYRNGTVTVVGSFANVEPANVKKYGVLLKTDRTTLANSTVEYTGADSYAGPTTLTNSSWWTSVSTETYGVGGWMEATNTTNTNQFTINVSRTAKTSFVMGAVVYVELNDGTKIYSPQELIAYNEVL